MSSISVSCPCGEVFERPIQRGRPAIWCPACRTLPMGQRPEKSATVAVVTVGADGQETVTEVERRTVSRFGVHDTLNYDERETIEEGMARLNAKFKEDIYPNRLAMFSDTPDPDRAASDWMFQQTTELYKGVKTKWWTEG